MQNNFSQKIARNTQKHTGKQNNRNPEVHVEDVKLWKDKKEHENVRRQRQDLFDNWESGAEDPSLKSRRFLHSKPERIRHSS